MRLPASTLRLSALAGSLLLVCATPAASDTRPPKTPTAPWVVAAAKHGGSGVRLSYRLPARLQPGEPATVELRLSGLTHDDAQLEWRAPEGSRMTIEALSTTSTVNGTAVPTAPLQGKGPRLHLARGQVTTVSLRVVPAGEGPQTLDLFTTQGERQSVQTLVLSVGQTPRRMKPLGTAQTTPSGETVISLPSTPAR